MKRLFELEKKPTKGLFAFEWVILTYLLLTLAMVLFCYTKLASPEQMIWLRCKAVLGTGIAWIAYRLAPCRLTMVARAIVPLAMLGEWYPDTYEINRILPNLDHVFATWEQGLFGCQPALLFHDAMPWTWFSELMCFGYFSYYLLIALAVVYYFFWRYEEFSKAVFIILGAFFAYYAIYDLVPVTGPQYYYAAVGIDQIAHGTFPDVGSYFFNHQERLPLPGSEAGFFHSMVEMAHDAGERPTAAFPSSHVGIGAVVMMLLIRARASKVLMAYVPVFLLLCLSTVYIQAHYAIDAIAGLITGIGAYYLFATQKKV